MGGIAVLRRTAETAKAVEDALEIHGLSWSTVEVAFSSDEPAEAKVTLIISRDQLVALARATTALGEKEVDLT